MTLTRGFQFLVQICITVVVLSYFSLTGFFFDRHPLLGKKICRKKSLKKKVSRKKKLIIINTKILRSASELKVTDTQIKYEKRKQNQMSELKFENIIQ